MRFSLQYAALFMVYLVLVPEPHVAFQIVNQGQYIDEVNGKQRVRHTTTFRCDQGDLTEQTLQLRSSDGTTRTVKVQCNPPEWLHNHDLLGFVPGYSAPGFGKVCSTDVPVNGSSLINDKGASSSAINNTHPNDPHDQLFNPLQHETHQHFTTLARRYSHGAPDDVYDEDSGQWMPNNKVASAARKLLTYNWPSLSSTSSIILGSATLYAGWRAYRTWKARRALNPSTGQVNPISDNSVNQASNSEIELTELGQGGVAEDAVEESQQAASIGGEALEAGALADAGEAAAIPGLGDALLVGMAIGVGIAVVCKLGLCLGRNNPSGLKNVLKNIYSEFKSVAAQLNTITDWAVSQKQFDDVVNNRFKNQDEFNQLINRNVERNTNDIILLNQDVQVLDNVTNAIYNAMNKDFEQIRQNAISTVTSIDTVWNATLALHESVVDQVRNIVTQLMNSNRAQRQIDNALVNLIHDRHMRRAIIDMFHKLIDIPFAQPVRPMVRFAGTPPLSRQARADLSRLQNGAFLVTSVVMQRTVLVSSLLAQEVNMSYYCDPVFLLNSQQSSVSFQDLFDNIGPGNCTALDRLAAPWTCRCVVVVERRSCTVLAGNAFPWQQGHTTQLLPENCNGGVSTQTLANGNPVDVLTSPADVYAYVSNDLCGDPGIQASTTGVIATNPVAGAKVRVFSDAWPRFHDLTLDTTTDPGACEANFALVFGDGDTHTRLAFNIYQLWSVAYDSIQRTRLVDLESQVYGTMASDVSFTVDPFDTDNKEQQKYQCVSFSVGLISDAKIPLYVSSLSQVIQNFRIEVDNEEIHTTSTGLSTPVTSKTLPSATSPGNVTVSSNLIVSDPVQAALPTRFFRYGAWRAGSELENTYDVPFDLTSSSGTAAGRAGKTNYVFQSRFGLKDVNTPITAAGWRSYYQTPLAPHLMGPAPANFNRTIRNIPGTQTFLCDKQIASNGIGQYNSTIDNEWCQILSFFDVLAINDQGQLLFRPHLWTYEVTVETPGGTFIINHLSTCPEATNVTRANGQVVVELNTSSPQAVTLNYEINGDSGPDSTCRPLVSSSCQYDDEQPCVIGPVNVNAICGNLRLQTFRLDTPTVGCFADGGIKLDVSHVIGGGGVLPGQIEHVQEVIEDQSTLDIINYTNYMADINNRINQLINEGLDPNTQEFVDRANAATEEATKAAQNMHSYNAGNEALVKRANRIIENNTITIINNTQTNENNSALIQRVLRQLQADTNESTALAARMARQIALLLAENNATQAGLAALANAINNYNKNHGGGGDSCPFHKIPMIGKMLCSIWKAFEGLIGGIIKIVLYVAVIGLALYLLIECGLPCVTGLVKGTVDAAKPSTNGRMRRYFTDDDYDDDEEEEDENRLIAPQELSTLNGSLEIQ